MPMPREVPPKFKELLTLRYVHKLTFLERIRLLLGLNVLFEARICTEHRVGRTQQRVKMELTELVQSPPTLAEELS